MSSNDNKSNVVTLDLITTLDLPPERIIKAAQEADLESAIVIGYKKDGSEYFSSSISDGTQVIWLMERFKKALLEVGD